MVAGKWEEILEDVHCPFALLHGVNDPALGTETLRTFAQIRANFTVGIFDKTGQLVFLRHAKKDFTALDTQNFSAH